METTESRGMSRWLTKRTVGFVLGVVVFALVKCLPLSGLSATVELTDGAQTCLALTLATVVFWACGVAQPGYIGLLYCVLLILFQVCTDDIGASSLSVTASNTFSLWTKATMWLVIGAYLIASAVKESGLGERIAYAFMLIFVKGYQSLVISIFVLTLILSLLIAVLSMVIHMFMGSVMAVLGVCVPAFIAFTSGTGVSRLQWP